MQGSKAIQMKTPFTFFFFYSIGSWKGNPKESPRITCGRHRYAQVEPLHCFFPLPPVPHHVHQAPRNINPPPEVQHQVPQSILSALQEAIFERTAIPLLTTVEAKNQVTQVNKNHQQHCNTNLKFGAAAVLSVFQKTPLHTRNRGWRIGKDHGRFSFFI